MNDKRMVASAITAEKLFVELLGRQPRWVVAAPGRVNLIGEHTDYNGGYVLPMAIDRHVAIAADLLTDNGSRSATVRVYSTLMKEWASFCLDDSTRPGHGIWSSYVAGTLAGCQEAGLNCPAFEAVIHADLPLGGGLSSSAALEVATATLLEAISGETLEPTRKAFVCQQAEHDYAGIPCGIMDQFSAVFGREKNLMLLDCRLQRVEMVPFTDPTVRVLIVNTNVKHKLADGEYAKRRKDCFEAAKIMGVESLRDATAEMVERGRSRLGEVRYRRARHVVSENERTLAAVQAIRDNQWKTTGELMYRSHASLRDDFAVSCAELDLLVELAREIGPDGGVFGARMTGGGFGGCTVSLVHEQSAAEVIHTIESRYSRKVGIEPSVFVTRPSHGAAVVKSPA